jgi:hypothetical protein
LKEKKRQSIAYFIAVTGITVDIQWPTQVTRVTKIDIEPQFETLTDVQIPDFENINHSIDSQPKENWDKHLLDAVEWFSLYEVQ